MTTATFPLIGIPCRHDASNNYNNSAINAQNDTYINAISQAGGIPFLLPLNLETVALRKLYDLAQGILLTGGGDLDPKLFQQPPHPTLSDVQPDRDELEITLSRWAAVDGKPLLGICRGIQVLAIASGGDLCQDIPSQMSGATLHHYGYINGQGPAWDELVHDVTLTECSPLASRLQTHHLRVNSLHHQAVSSVGESLTITGYSSDGVIEVVEVLDHPFYCGVQWHPETLRDEHKTAERLFTVFIEACVAYSYKKAV